MTEREFMAAYSPARQAAVTRDEREVFCGKAPTLMRVAQELGHDTVRVWLLEQLDDLARFAGSQKLTRETLVQTADVIAGVHRTLKVTELMYFFLHLKGGRWCDYYAVGNGLQITTALQLFMADRCRIMARLEEDERERRTQQERSRKRVTGLAAYEEYRRQCIAQGHVPFMERMARAGKGGAA